MERDPAPAVVGGIADITDGGAQHEFGAVMSRIRSPLPLVPANPEDFDPIDREPFARPGLYHGVTMFTRPFDKATADYLTGNHAVIERFRGFPKGAMEPIGGAYPVVYRPRALPWDCGTAVNTAAPPAPGR